MHLSSTSIVGTNVQNAQGESLGEIEDLMVNTHSGDVDYAVVSFGGFLGMGDKLFAVPLQAFNTDTDAEKMILDVPKDRLESAPGFDKDNWPKHGDTKWTQDVRTYYGV